MNPLYKSYLDRHHPSWSGMLIKDIGESEDYFISKLVGYEHEGEIYFDIFGWINYQMKRFLN